MEKEFLVEIPENDYEITYTRSSGPGGQNVNKLSTKAQLRFSIGKSGLSDEQKELLRQKLESRVTVADKIVLTSGKTRSQKQNRIDVIDRLHLLINKTLAGSKERKPTKPTRASKERRVKAKKLHSQTKQKRRLIKPYEIS